MKKTPVYALGQKGRNACWPGSPPMLSLVSHLMTAMKLESDRHQTDDIRFTL